MLTSHCEKQSSTCFLKERRKISGQQVTLAHVFWIKIVLLNQILFIFKGAIGSLKLLLTKHKCFSLKSTAKAEWTSFPTWLTPKTSSRNPANQCHLHLFVVHTSDAPWIKEQEIVLFSNLRFPVLIQGTHLLSLNSVKTLCCLSVSCCLSITLQIFNLLISNFIISHRFWSPMTLDGVTHTTCTPTRAVSTQICSLRQKVESNNRTQLWSLIPSWLFPSYGEGERVLLSVHTDMIGVTQCMATTCLFTCLRTSFWFVC